jgi:hypothetical protein
MSETTSGITPSAEAKNLFDKLLRENSVPTIPPPLTTRQHAEMQIQTGVIVDQARATATEIHRDVMNARPGIAKRAASSALRKITAGRKFTGAGDGMKIDQQSLASAPAPLDGVSLPAKHISHRIGAQARPTMQQHADAGERTGGGVKLTTASGDTTREAKFSARVRHNVGAVRTDVKPKEQMQPQLQLSHPPKTLLKL